VTPLLTIRRFRFSISCRANDAVAPAIHLSAIKSIDNSPGGIFFQQRSALAALLDEG
jgi:hypothetical protein